MSDTSTACSGIMASYFDQLKVKKFYFLSFFIAFFYKTILVYIFVIIFMNESFIEIVDEIRRAPVQMRTHR